MDNGQKSRGDLRVSSIFHNNCDTSIEYIQDHYFHYEAKKATGALATGRKGLRTAKGKDLGELQDY